MTTVNKCIQLGCGMFNGYPAKINLYGINENTVIVGDFPEGYGKANDMDIIVQRFAELLQGKVLFSDKERHFVIQVDMKIINDVIFGFLSDLA